MSLLSSKQLRECGLKNGPKGQLSRVDRQVAEMLETAVRMGLLEIAEIPAVNKFYGLFPSEILAVADVIGVSGDNKAVQRLRDNAFKATYNGVLRRTDRANEVVIAAAAAGEDLEPDRLDPAGLTPLAGVSIGPGDLDYIADKYENVLCLDGDHLMLLDSFRQARRCVRQILRIFGAQLSVRVPRAYPADFCLKINNALIGTEAVDNAARVLEHAMETNERFSAPMERFWQASALVLRTVGVDVEEDLDARWNMENEPRKAPEFPFPALKEADYEGMPF